MLHIGTGYTAPSEVFPENPVNESMTLLNFNAQYAMRERSASDLPSNEVLGDCHPLLSTGLMNDCVAWFCLLTHYCMICEKSGNNNFSKKLRRIILQLAHNLRGSSQAFYSSQKSSLGLYMPLIILIRC